MGAPGRLSASIMRRSSVLALTAVTLAVAGCGSGQHHATTTRATTRTHASGPVPLSVTVRRTGAGSAFATTATAAPGQAVEVQAVVPGTRTTPPEPVQLTLAQGKKAITV